MPAKREYELVYIVAPVATDTEVEALQAEIDGHIQSLGGGVTNSEVWGRRKLAYPIGHYGEGIYIAQLLDGPADMVSELERRLRVRDQVLRHLIVRVDEDLRKARRAAEKRKATADHRREARGLPPRAAHPPAADAAAPAADTPIDAPPAAAAVAPAADTPTDAPPPEAVAAPPAVDPAPTVPSADTGATETAVETLEVKE